MVSVLSPLPASLADTAKGRRSRPALTAKAVWVTDQKSGKVLLQQNADQVRSIASLTKLQAALVVTDRGLKLEEGTVISRDDWKVALGGCRTRLELKWTYRNRDLLGAALMSSDNRAVSALGRAVGLHATALVQAMNEKARQMGLRKTRFRDPVGIDPGNVSTAREVAKIVRVAGRNRTLSRIMGRRALRVRPMRGYLTRRFGNSNALVGRTEGLRFLASKTGYNSQAGYCVAVVVRIGKIGTYSVVLLGSKSKFHRINDQKKTLAWLRARRHR
jgi:D-alanyl-D-alanine endopeptidase (penicillin-binding protein 7)